MPERIALTERFVKRVEAGPDLFLVASRLGRLLETENMRAIQFALDQLWEGAREDAHIYLRASLNLCQIKKLLLLFGLN